MAHQIYICNNIICTIKPAAGWYPIFFIIPHVRITLFIGYEFRLSKFHALFPISALHVQKCCHLNFHFCVTMQPMPSRTVMWCYGMCMRYSKGKRLSKSILINVCDLIMNNNHAPTRIKIEEY